EVRRAGRYRNEFRIEVVGNRRNPLGRRKNAGRNEGLNVGDEVGQRANWNGEGHFAASRIDGAENADNLFRFRIHNKTAAGAWANGRAGRELVVESEKAGSGFVSKFGGKALQASDWIDGFFRKGVDIDLLANAKIVEAKSNSAVGRKRVLQ